MIDDALSLIHDRKAKQIKKKKEENPRIIHAPYAFSTQNVVH